MRRPAIHEQVNDPFGFGAELRWSGSERRERGRIRSGSRKRGEQAGQTKRAESHAATVQEFPASLEKVFELEFVSPVFWGANAERVVIEIPHRDQNCPAPHKGQIRILLAGELGAVLASGVCRPALRPGLDAFMRQETPVAAVQLPVEGDVHPLAACLGSGARVPALAWPGGEIRNLEDLECFLDRYFREWLLPSELPRILQAALLASQSKFREITSLDSPDGQGAWLPPLAEASRKSGSLQLRKMMALRDLKGLRRYGEAVRQGKATGSHTVVFGTMLGIYAISLRQGLMHYARQTMLGLAEAGADRLKLGEEQRRTLMDGWAGKIEQPLRHQMDQLLANGLELLG